MYECVHHGRKLSRTIKLCYKDVMFFIGIS